MKIKIKYLLLGCISLLALASCTEEKRESSAIENENVMVKLTAIVDSKEFSTDSEIVPMRATRAMLENYKVAYIANYTMVIIKKISEEVWAIEEVKKIMHNDYIMENNGFRATIQQTLRPGIYKFLLLINGSINEKLEKGLTFTEADIPWLTNEKEDFSYYDIFFAKEDVIIEKKETLNEANSQPVILSPARYSSLIRFAFNGQELFPPVTSTSTIRYKEVHTISGLDLLGEDVTSTSVHTMERQCVIQKRPNDDKDMFFSFFENENKLINLLSPSASEKKISLTINSIGEMSITEPYEIPAKTSRNRIMTILLQKGSDVQISHTIEEKAPLDWNIKNEIPWGFVELNNHL